MSCELKTLKEIREGERDVVLYKNATKKKKGKRKKEKKKTSQEREKKPEYLYGK